VFYRDDGLISEGLEQFDLSIAEWADLSASNVNHANSGTCANQGHGEIGAKTEASSDVASLRVLISFGLQIGYVDRSPFQNGPVSKMPTHQGGRASHRKRPMVGDEQESVVVYLANHRVIGLTKASRTRRDLCEHTLRIRRRT